MLLYDKDTVFVCYHTTTRCYVRVRMLPQALALDDYVTACASSKYAAIGVLAHVCALVLLQAAIYASACSYKLSRLIAADSIHFEQVWAMHEGEVQTKVLRMLQADKLTH